MQGIHNYSPVQAHRSCYVASLIARLNSEKYTHHQNKSESIWSTWKAQAQELQVGDQVLYYLKPKNIQKEASVFYRRLSSESHFIKEIDKSSFPYTYILTNFPRINGLKRKFYGHQLKKITANPNSSRTINVQDIYLDPEEPRTRSGHPRSPNLVPSYLTKHPTTDESILLKKEELTTLQKKLNLPIRWESLILEDPKKTKFTF